MSPLPAPHPTVQFLCIASFLALQGTLFPLQLLPYLQRLFEHPRRILAHHRQHSMHLRCSEFRIPPLKSLPSSGHSIPCAVSSLIGRSSRFQRFDGASFRQRLCTDRTYPCCFFSLSFTLPKPLPHPDSLPASHPCSAFRL